MPGGTQVRPAFSGSPLAKQHRDNGLLTEKVHGHTSEIDKTHVQLKCLGWGWGVGRAHYSPAPDGMAFCVSVSPTSFPMQGL